MNIFSRFFGQPESRSVAKDRLQLVLIHDRSDISPQVMESLRRDIIDVISKYMDIDERHIELQLEREDSSVALVANIPVRTVRRTHRGGERQIHGA